MKSENETPNSESAPYDSEKLLYLKNKNYRIMQEDMMFVIAIRIFNRQTNTYYFLPQPSTIGYIVTIKANEVIQVVQVSGDLLFEHVAQTFQYNSFVDIDAHIQLIESSPISFRVTWMQSMRQV